MCWGCHSMCTCSYCEGVIVIRWSHLGRKLLVFAASASQVAWEKDVCTVWVVRCFGGDVVLCRGFLVVGNWVESLCGGVRCGFCLSRDRMAETAIFSGMSLMCGQESPTFMYCDVQAVGWWSCVQVPTRVCV